MSQPQFTLPDKIRKVILGMPVERLLRSRSSFLGHRFSEDSGDESDFREYLNYIPGEDPKRIDWKVYARSDNRVVKKFSSEKSRNVYLCLDCSASMGDEGCRHFIDSFYYLIVYLYLKEECYGVIFLTEKETRVIKSASGPQHLRKVETAFRNIRFEGGSRLSDAFIRAVKPLERDSEILWFSDFQNYLPEISKAVDIALFRKLYLTLITAFNHRAYEPALGDKGSWLRDEETGLRKFVDRGLIKAYQKEVVGHYRQIEELTIKKNARYVQIDSHEDGLDGFLKLFQ